MRKKVLAVFGTRPEAIKMAPVIRALETSAVFEPVVCVTGQHRAMLDQMLAFFGLTAQFDLNLMRPNQNLSELTAEALTRLKPVLQAVNPAWVIVQGDTATAMAAGLSAFYACVPLAHVEAGLRTRNKHAPFPEEINRRIVGVMADLHFPPTEGAALALRNEGHDPRTIHVTGNTVIDSLLWAKERLSELAPPFASRLAGKRLILVTMHRRESFDSGIASACAAIAELVARFSDTAVVLPVHPNPNVKGEVERQLGNLERVHLVEPQEYGHFVWLLDKAHLILTDSGGIQEEATALGKPMLILRDVTERPEAIHGVNARLIGADAKRLTDEAGAILADAALHREMSAPSAVFGDGMAGERIVRILEGV